MLITQQTIEERFWLYWGIAPEGTPKYKAGLKALAFIVNQTQEAYEKGFQFGSNQYRNERDILLKDLEKVRKEIVAKKWDDYAQGVKDGKAWERVRIVSRVYELLEEEGWGDIDKDQIMANISMKLEALLKQEE